MNGNAYRNASELMTVRHIAHVQSALRIIQDRRIKAGLVYDESKLNKYRISVSWVSANTWAFGSIYGTVEFKFSWADLIANQNIYWVEAMTNYKPNAYRLLLSKRNITSGVVRRYNPEADDGPLRFKDAKYYWNGDYTSEFMIEDDLSLDRCNGVSFIAHHAQYAVPLGLTARTESHSRRRSEPAGGYCLLFLLVTFMLLTRI
jgi:hypothetical protein